MTRPIAITGAFIGLTLVAGLAMAKAPEHSLRPVARPGPVQTEVAQPARHATTKAKRPEARPDKFTSPGRDEPGYRTAPKPRQGETLAALQPEPRTERRGLFRSLRPLLRPREVGKKAVARKSELARGAVCGDVAIQGVEIGAVRGEQNGCGVLDAVKVREISGVALSQNAVMDCVTAKALKSWINNGMKPAIGTRGGGVSHIRVAAHYACRGRNGQSGAKISEHGRGRAIDIAGFTLRDGSDITVLTDWNKGDNGQSLHRMHKTACGTFGTVLGPGANRHHQDHFHFDTARYRSGSYCR